MVREFSERELLLLHCLSKGHLAPVDKLIGVEELTEILEEYTYHGELYSLPYLFFVDEPYLGEETLECRFRGNSVCTIQVNKYYAIDLESTALLMFATSDTSHPGVADLYTNEYRYCVDGDIQGYSDTAFKSLGIPYTSITRLNEYVFQSRNPPHKAHEHIIETYSALGKLLYTTPYSTTKVTDYSFADKIICYEKIKEQYDTDLLVTLLPRVFAGPREALQNVLLMCNFGCTKFIMGRGKNCVADFYTPTESYEFCKKFEKKTDVEILYQATQYVGNTELQASKIKSEFINNDVVPPSAYMSPFISEILLQHG